MDEELESTEEIEDTEAELADDDGADEEYPDLSELSDEELVELEAELVAEYETSTTTEEFTVGDDDAIADAESLVEAIEFVQAEMTAREEVLAANARRVALDERAFATKGETFAAKMQKKSDAEDAKDGGADESAEMSSEDDESSDDKETETAPSTEETVALSDETEIKPDGLAGNKPSDAVKTFNHITASADVPGFAAGQELPSLADVAKAFMAKRPSVRGTDKGNDGYRYLVASLAGSFEDERMLNRDVEANMAKIEAVTAPEAIVASGGFCAPLTPYYALQTFGDTGRPVRDSLPAFKAERGGIRFMPPPVLSSLAGSVRRTTAAQDAAGYTNQTPVGTTAPKPCLHVTCTAEQTAVVEAVSRCLTFGNLGARTYPEQVEAWLKLVMVEYSRYAEVELLDMISAASTAVTPAAQWGGATANLLEQVTLAVTAFRARNRVMNGVNMKALMPFWAKEFIRTDISHQPPFDGLSIFAITDEMIASWFASRGISVTWYQDNTTAAGAPFAAQTAGALKDWPDTIVWFLYPEGAFLYLDGGSLDLGLVRDSTLNSQNDYQIWAEEFFSVVYLGTEAYKVTSTLCPDGRYGGFVQTGAKPGCP